MASRLGIAFQSFRRRPWWRKLFDFILVAFAIAGASIIGAWGIYQLGLTNNSGAIDKNHRELLSVAQVKSTADSLAPATTDSVWVDHFLRLAAFGRYYPNNAHLIWQAALQSGDPMLVDRMLSAASIYADTNHNYEGLANTLRTALHAIPTDTAHRTLVPWMQGEEWAALKVAIMRDSALLCEAGRLTGVEPRLIVGCLVGEQIRLFNSKREMYKRYLGPVKVLSVQSQFSYGVNGIKDFTAEAVELHLKDTASVFYMGPEYANLLDFSTTDHPTERYNRLVDYQNHLYSYLYTGCILHQTMLQWRRAGFDIADRPDLLFTLFNVGFDNSQPKADPMPGGSHIRVGDSIYTFGGIGFDFYYSGELFEAFPIQRNHFTEHPHAIDAQELLRIQEGVSNCQRPEMGLEYKTQPSAAPTTPDPYGINHEAVTPTPHTAQ